MDPRYQQAIQQAYEQGRLAERQNQATNLDLHLQEEAQRIRAEFDQRQNRMAGGLRKMVDEKAALLGQRIDQMAAMANHVSAERAGGSGGYQRDEGNIVRPGMVRIEDIPGRRVPFTLLVKIPIGANQLATREASVTISQEGPFVAVKRMAAFQSAYEAQTTDPETGDQSRFATRSFGRYRPVSSSWDLLDSQHNAIADTSLWFWNAISSGVPVGTELPEAVLGQPSSMSSFRTMEFDGEIEVINAGSSYPRQNRPVPSAWWSTSINAPWDLGCLDFFERSETITVKSQPTHVNNPPAGNVDGSAVFPTTGNAGTGYPFLAGQFDAHEGIATPGALAVGQIDPDLPDLLADDSVERLPDGVLILGWEGYRIIQPIGPAV